MAMSVVYSNAFGGVFAENRGGTVSIYVPDTQGSTIGLVSSSGVLTDRWVYWPYGEVASRAGTNVTPLTWLGTLGYYLDQVSKLFYVRARHLRADLARWLTADPLWPRQPAYSYVKCAPTATADRSGLGPDVCEAAFDAATIACGVLFAACAKAAMASFGACCESCTELCLVVGPIVCFLCYIACSVLLVLYMAACAAVLTQCVLAAWIAFCACEYEALGLTPQVCQPQTLQLPNGPPPPPR